MPHYLRNIVRLWSIIKPFHKYFYLQLGFIIVSQGLIVAIAFGQSTILNMLVQKNITFLGYAFIVYALLYVLDDCCFVVRDIT
jgi:hypothetical protein